MRKYFKHSLVPEIKISSEIVDGSRYYTLENGKKYRSVTTIISQKSDKTSLLEWKKRVGEEEAKRISAVASSRGTAVHAIAEKYVLNEDDYSKNVSPINLDTFNSIKPFIDKYIGTIYGIELPLYSDLLNAAGRTDVVADFDGTLSIVDFKTSKKEKKEEWIRNYFIQTTAYALMYEEMYSVKVPQIAIMIAVDNDPAQLFVKKTKDYYQDVKRFFID
jgi:genome maintenance exonuclease 1